MSDMVDMSLTPAEQRARVAPYMDSPIAMICDYPPGLTICLTDVELGKLGLEADCETGDMLSLDVIAKVMSCSSNIGPDGEKKCRVELQICEMGIEAEPENDKPAPPASRAKRYATSAASEADAGE